MIDIRQVGKMLEAWAILPSGGVFLFRGSDYAFVTQQAFVRDGKVTYQGHPLEREVKHDKRWWRREMRKAERGA